MKVKMITILTIIVTLQFSCVNHSETIKSAEEIITIQEVVNVDSVDQEPKEIDTVGEEKDAQNSIEEEEIVEAIQAEQKVESEKEDLEINKEKIDLKEKEEVVEVIEEAQKEMVEEVHEAIVSEEVANEEVLAKTEQEVVEQVIPETVDEEVIVAKPNHAAFDALLSAHVSSKGVVNYDGFKSSISKLDAYLKDLDENSIASDWSKNEKLAYWINAYNAFTIKLILDNYPVKSIQDIAGGKPWDKKWIKLAGKTYSLNQIENDIIRPQFKEPRIHFAVNCAAQSCPPLANKAFTAGNMNSLLDKQTKAFVNNAKYNKISAKSATVSKIFDWYGVDFGDKLAFLNTYSTTKIASGTEITYTEYDWGLNNK